MDRKRNLANHPSIHPSKQPMNAIFRTQWNVPFNENAECRYHRTRMMHFSPLTHSQISSSQPSFSNPNPKLNLDRQFAKHTHTQTHARASESRNAQHTLLFSMKPSHTSTQICSEILIKKFHFSLWTLWYSHPFRGDGGGDELMMWTFPGKYTCVQTSKDSSINPLIEHGESTRKSIVRHARAHTNNNPGKSHFNIYFRFEFETNPWLQVDACIRDTIALVFFFWKFVSLLGFMIFWALLASCPTESGDSILFHFFSYCNSKFTNSL